MLSKPEECQPQPDTYKLVQVVKTYPTYHLLVAGWVPGSPDTRSRQVLSLWPGSLARPLGLEDCTEGRKNARIK